MNDLDFKLTLIKALEHNANTQSAFNTEAIWKIISSLPLCNLYIEDTCIQELSGILIVQFFIFKCP